MSTSSDLTDIDKKILVAKIDRRRGAGMSVAAACDHEGLNSNTYYSWKRKFAWKGKFEGAADPDPDPGPGEVEAPGLPPIPEPGPDEPPAGRGKGKGKPGPDLAFLDLGRGHVGGLRDQLVRVTRERDELRRILMDLLSGRVAPPELLEGMLRALLEGRMSVPGPERGDP
jgi:hypothetical protein